MSQVPFDLLFFPQTPLPKAANDARNQGAFINSFLLVGRLEKEDLSGSKLKRQIESDGCLFIIFLKKQTHLNGRALCLTFVLLSGVEMFSRVVGWGISQCLQVMRQ